MNDGIVITDDGAVDFDNIVDKSTINEGGYTGEFLKFVSNHVGDLIDKNLLNQSEAGEVYITGIEKALKNALKFELSDKLLEAKIRSEKNKWFIFAARKDMMDDEYELAQDIQAAAIALDNRKLALLRDEADDSMELLDKNLVLQGRITTSKEAMLRAQIELEKANILIAKEENKIALQELAIREQEVLITSAKLDVAEQEVLLAIAMVLVKTEELKLMCANILSESEKTALAIAKREQLTLNKVNKIIAETDLLNRQITGFEEHAKYEYSASLLEVWGISYSSLPTSEGIPSEISSLANNAATTNTPLP